MVNVFTSFPFKEDIWIATSVNVYDDQIRFTATTPIRLNL